MTMRLPTSDDVDQREHLEHQIGFVFDQHIGE